LSFNTMGACCAKVPKGKGDEDTSTPLLKNDSGGVKNDNII